jgi:hypothetical protein
MSKYSIYNDKIKELILIEPNNSKIAQILLNTTDSRRKSKTVDTLRKYVARTRLGINPNIRNDNPIKRLFFDIETSPMIVYSWRVGWKLNIGTHNIIEDWKIICISYKWEHEDKVHNFTWDKNKCDKQMLIDFIEVMNQADECIAHNGDRFDIKKIRTRCIFHRIPMFPNYKTLDTLKKAKSGFNFNSNRLDYIAKFLGVGAKLEHEGFDMWVKCMQGDPQALKDMVLYCDMDIIVLEAVYLVMQNWIKPNTHSGVLNNNLKYSCSCCGDEEPILLKNIVTAMGSIKRQMECSNCNYVYDISNSSYMLMLKFKNLI